MTIIERLRAYRTNHWIFCVGSAIIAALAIAGAFFTLSVEPLVAVAVFALSIGCVILSAYHFFQANRHSRLIFVEESKTRVSRI